MKELFQEYRTDKPLFKEKEIQLKCVSHNGIIQSKDKLFCVQFTPQRNILARWYLVQVDLANTPELNLNTK